MLSHLWFLGWVRLVKTRLRYQKIFAMGFAWGNIFLVASMVLAILHNVIIGQTLRLGACTSRGKGCTIMPHYVT
ncbi:MAG: hypothetical protein RBT61_01235 [Candidatus Kapabacteria bacterium]|jgi:hypothetical protein|nr:hypothetical protein [Candidatus Kapabacteria bacterium]